MPLFTRFQVPLHANNYSQTNVKQQCGLYLKLILPSFAHASPCVASFSLLSSHGSSLSAALLEQPRGVTATSPNSDKAQAIITVQVWYRVWLKVIYIHRRWVVGGIAERSTFCRRGVRESQKRRRAVGSGRSRNLLYGTMMMGAVKTRWKISVPKAWLMQRIHT